MLKTDNPQTTGTRVKWRHRIAVRLITVFFMFSVLIFGATLGYNYYQARAMITGTLEVNARQLVTAAAGKVETVIASVTVETESMARALETFPNTKPQLLDYINASVLSHLDVFGSAVAFDPSPDSRF